MTDTIKNEALARALEARDFYADREAATELRRLSAERDALRAECDALRADAERWGAVRLRARSQRIDGEDWLSLGILPWPRTGQATTPDYADAAIDAAMKG